ncbi:MAG: DsbA family oxidoreductase [Pseudomonadota bacterium]
MMKIEIFSDIACPWCFIGKRRLERALLNSGTSAQLSFRAFQLQPGLPADGVPAEAFFERKFGGKERVRGIFERVTEVGRADGIHFDFDRQLRAPNTELAQRVIRFASDQGQAAPTVEALFSGFFEQGVNVCELTEIVHLLERAQVALDSTELVAALASGFGKEQVASDLSLAREYGIGGVPLFIFDQRYSVEGAQPVEHFERLIHKLRAEDSPHLRSQPPA